MHRGFVLNDYEAGDGALRNFGREAVKIAANRVWDEVALVIVGDGGGMCIEFVLDAGC